MARILPINLPHPRLLGSESKVLHVPDDFDAPLSEDLLDVFDR